MTPKQQRFIAEYLVDLNATQAAIRAGYSAKIARQQGAQNLSKHDIAEAVSAGKRAQLEQAGLSAERVLQEIQRLLTANVADLFDDAGNLKGIHQVSRDIAATIASLEVVKKNAEAGDGKIDVIHKLKLWDKIRAIEMAAKHFGLLTERLEHSGSITIIHELPHEPARPDSL